MRHQYLRRIQRFFSSLLLCATMACLAMISGSTTAAGQPQSHDFATTVAYVETFYPLWFTYYQSFIALTNSLVGPDKISPVYQSVVAINDDTLYASAFLNLTEQPVILTVPVTPGAYSVLTVDPYGDIFESGIPSQGQGAMLPMAVYGLYGPDYTGTLPAGVIPIAMPLNFQLLVFRIDKYSASGENQTQEASEFRATLQMQTLCDYLKEPCPDGSSSSDSGYTTILPEIEFGIPFKTIADRLIAKKPIEFLEQLQTAVLAPNTPPMTPQEQALSDEFNALFGNGNHHPKKSDFAAGAQAAHAEILDAYLNHLGPNNWIHFTNIGDWGDNVLDRSAITEFLQFGNGIATAAYYHTFRDGDGQPLEGQRHEGYVLTFAPDGQPSVERFWSLTAYTPQSIELIPNRADKYLVASYTPGLEYNHDGSLSIYISRRKPFGVAEANWLPVSNRPFNIMLRVYGVVPGSSVANNTYVPPAIVPRD